jgi:hypothetical protein
LKNRKGQDLLRDLGVGGRIVLKWIKKEVIEYERDSTGLMWGSVAGGFEHGN